MIPKEVGSAFYAAYASGDPRQIADLLHEEVIWVAPPRNATRVALGFGWGRGRGAAQ